MSRNNICVNSRGTEKRGCKNGQLWCEDPRCYPVCRGCRFNSPLRQDQPPPNRPVAPSDLVIFDDDISEEAVIFITVFLFLLTVVIIVVLYIAYRRHIR